MKTDMAVDPTDWKTKLVADIVVMRGREVPVITAAGIKNIFEAHGEKISRAAVRRLCDMDNLPSNIVGAIQRKIAEILGEWREAQEWRLRKEDQSNAGTAQEFQEMMKFFTELTEWHRLGLVDRNPDGVTVPMTIDEYRAAGRPVTWSPIVDQWLKGFESAYEADLLTAGALLDFLMRYNRKLEGERIKRMAQAVKKMAEEDAEQSEQ